MLKLSILHKARLLFHQPPSGGCVLKRITTIIPTDVKFQPPSGGCVLKLNNKDGLFKMEAPAAFRRLCVETHNTDTRRLNLNPAAFRRLCVETLPLYSSHERRQSSRLQAAVC